MRTGHTAAIACCLLLGGCGTDPNAFHLGCQHISSMQVGPGLTPLIDWSPNCGVAGLTVYAAQDPVPGQDPSPTFPGTNLTPGPIVWALYNPDSTGNILEPSVRYGKVPAGIVAWVPAEPLVSGRDYLVSVGAQRIDGGSPIRGYGTFRP
jgi:hypothetical protein